MSKDLEGRELLTAIVDMAEQNRPVKWIARSTGLTARDINGVLKVAGTPAHDVHDLTKYDRMEHMVQEGYSHSEIVKTLGGDHRTITRWFPGTQWAAGGWADAGGLIRELARKQREFERTGTIKDPEDRVYRGTQRQRDAKKKQAEDFVEFGGFKGGAR